MITANPAADDERRRRAATDAHASPSGCWCSPPWSTSLTLDQDGFLGFVNAGAEASMVGAIADWFAVTALFKHPLGLPIPHTALVPEAQGRARQGPGGVLRGELPAGGDHPRAGRGRGDLAAAREWLSQPAERAPGGRRGRRGRRDRAGARCGDEHIAELVRVGAGAAVPRGADRAAARHVRGRGGARRPAPRRGRPGAGGAARLAGREPRHGRRGAQRAGAVVGAAPAQRGGHRPDPHRGGPLGRGHPRRPAPPRPRGPRLDARAARPGPAVRPGHPGPRRGAQEPAARPPAVHRRPAISLWNALRRALLAALRDPSGALRGAAAGRAGRPSPSG